MSESSQMNVFPATSQTLLQKLAAQITGERESAWVRFFGLYEPAIKRFVWQRDGGLCRICKREGIENGVDGGYIVSGFACHHVIPFESAKSKAEMERLFLDVNNIILVCKDCHAKIHREMKSHTKEKVAERKAQRRSRFLERNDPNFTNDDPNKPPYRVV